MFTGEYQHLIDSKNRLFVPAAFRKKAGRKFVITCGLEQCLFMYTPGEWKRITSRFTNIPFTKSDARKFLRIFLSGAVESFLDVQGRVLLPQNLASYAHLAKNAMLIGVGSRIEIWNRNEWIRYRKDAREKYVQIAEKLVDFGI